MLGVLRWRDSFAEAGVVGTFGVAESLLISVAFPSLADVLVGVFGLAGAFVLEEAFGPRETLGVRPKRQSLDRLRIQRRTT